MMKLAAPFALAGAVGLSACAVVPPSGPSFAAMPGPGKSFPQFQDDDARCRQIAAAGNGNVTPGQAATQSGVGSAAIGTGIGAAAGALLGAAAGSPGIGAAIGAGTGLLAGSAVGADTAQMSAAGMQQHYDVTYAQCMAGAGESVPNPSAGPPAGYGYGAPAYGYGAPAYGYGPPVAYAPPVVMAPPMIGLGIGFGGGWGGGWGGGYGGGWRRW
ncbi:MAG TPA: glycine zipper family protein [Acetobacteraceae bacterium]|nr:glycine zipper family protein [Acetobacteraceae bacterium]